MYSLLWLLEGVKVVTLEFLLLHQIPLLLSRDFHIRQLYEKRGNR